MSSMTVAVTTWGPSRVAVGVISFQIYVLHLLQSIRVDIFESFVSIHQFPVIQILRTDDSNFKRVEFLTENQINIYISFTIFIGGEQQHPVYFQS